ncbi:MAG: hypothetical protein AAF196_16030 [Planctomycetota bacterium]
MTTLDKSIQPVPEPEALGRPMFGVPFDPHPAEEEESPLPIRRLVSGVYRRFWYVWLFGLIGAGLGLAAVVLRPKSYEAEAVFLLDTGGEQVRITPDPLLETLPNGIAGNLPYVLTSYELCARVVDDVGPEAILAPFRKSVQAPVDASYVDRLRAWLANIRQSITRRSSDELRGADARAEAIERLQESLNVTIPAYASVLFVTYTAPDPYAARDTLKAYTRHAREWHLEVYDDSPAIELLERSYDAAKVDRDTANENYSTFLRGLEVQDFQRAITKLRENVDEYSDLGKAAARRVSDLEFLQRQQFQRFSDTKEVEVFTEDVVRRDPIAERLVEDIQAAQANLDEVEMIRRPDDPKVEMASQSLDDLRARLAQRQKEWPTRYSEQREQRNPLFDQLRTQLAQIDFDLEKARLEEKRLSDRLLEEQAALQKLEEREGRHAELLAAVEKAAGEVRVMDAQMGRVRAKQSLKENDVSSLRVLQDPLPGERKSIRSIFVLGGATVVFAGFGLVLALGLALLDRRVRFTSDLESISCGPVLGAVPQSGRRNVARHIRERQRL